MSDIQRVPVHADEKKDFTPVAFKELENPPSFTLKTPTRKQREEMQYALHEAGLRRHDDEALREVTVEELCRLWECDEHDENVQRLRRFWSAVDDYNSEAETYLLEVAASHDAGEEAPPPFADFEHPDQGPVDELIARLTRSSTRLRRLGTDNVRFAKEFPRYAIAHALRRWTGLDTKPRYEEGVVQVEVVCELQDEMVEKHGDAGDMAYTELAAAAVARFFLTKATEKNLSSGPVSQRTPSDSKETSSASPNGNSLASESSTATPAD